MLAPGAQLAQKTGDLTTAATLYTTSKLNTEISLITVQVDQNCDCTIYHDDDGTTYGLAQQIWFESRTTALNKEAVYDGKPIAIYVKAGGALGVKCSVNGAAVITVYGFTQQGR